MRPHAAPARIAQVAVAVALVAGVIVIGVAEIAPRNHQHRSAASRPLRPPPSAPTSKPAYPKPHSSTPPPPRPPILVSTVAGYALYRVGGPAAIVLDATTTTCWVEIRSIGPSGPVLYQGDLLAGETHQVTNPAWVRLGNPHGVAVTVNGGTIVPPSLIAGEPYNLQFE